MQERKFLLITLTVVLLVGGPTVVSIVREPQAKSNSSAGGRAPASIIDESSHQEDFQVHNPIQAKSISLHMPCESLSSQHDVDGSLLRLSNTCENGVWKGLSITRVINKTNGFTADVIQMPEKGFTTDFIDLAQGENIIEITVKDSKGVQSQAELHVNRKPASESF